MQIYHENKGDKIKVFFEICEGIPSSVLIGNRVVPTKQGIQFYVDDYVADQIHKCELYIDGLTPKLRLKEGETLFVPEECDEYKRQKEIEELEKKLKELKGDAE